LKDESEANALRQLMLRFTDAVTRAVRPERRQREEARGVLLPEERNMFGARDRARIGRWAEDRAADFLVAQGVRIIDRNVRERFSEIDIVGNDGGELIFAEVRCRRANSVMTALDTLGPQKWRRLARGAELYVQRVCWKGNWRVDLVAVDVENTNWRLKWYRYLEMEEVDRYGC
jgi:putative endonuclease